MGPEQRGAYGFRLVWPPHQEALPDLGPVPADSPEVTVEWRHASPLGRRAELTADRLLSAERNGSLLEVRRDPATIVLELAEPTTPEALVHPLLTTPISVLARWRGDLTLHAGSFVAGERAWAVVGEREAGKSTALTMLALRGCPLLADDLLVVDAGDVRAGPTCIDLRPDAAARVPAARSLGEVGGRERFRLSAPRGPARAPLAGFFLLEWSTDGEVAVEPMSSREALPLFYRQEYIGLLGPADPQKILGLLGTPAWRVRRPRDWRRGEEAIDRVLAVTEDAGGG